MGIFTKDKLKFKRFDHFEERAFDQICMNVHKIVKHDFTFDNKHRQDGYYQAYPNGPHDQMYTEWISYDYFNKKNKNWKNRLSIYFYKYFISNLKDFQNFSSALLPNPVNDKYITTLAFSARANIKYPICFVYITDNSPQFSSTNARLIKYEYDQQSDKIKIDTHVSKKCVRLIQNETTKIIKKIFKESD